MSKMGAPGMPITFWACMTMKVSFLWAFAHILVVASAVTHPAVNIAWYVYIWVGRSKGENRLSADDRCSDNAARGCFLPSDTPRIKFTKPGFFFKNDHPAYTSAMYQVQDVGNKNPFDMCSMCSNTGGVLCTIYGQTVHEDILALQNDRCGGGIMWIGLNDCKSGSSCPSDEFQCSQDQEGTFGWMDSSTVVYGATHGQAPWNSNEPNEDKPGCCEWFVFCNWKCFHGEDHVEMFSNGRWNDAAGNSEKPCGCCQYNIQPWAMISHDNLAQDYSANLVASSNAKRWKISFSGIPPGIYDNSVTVRLSSAWTDTGATLSFCITDWCAVCNGNSRSCCTSGTKIDASTCSCDAGYALGSDPTKCEACPVGWYSAGESDPCHECGGGLTTTCAGCATSFSDCVCPKGEYDDNSVCKDCEVDTYGDVAGLVGSCKPCTDHSTTNGVKGAETFALCYCLPGYMMAGPSANLCNACGPSTFKSTLGSASCTQCSTVDVNSEHALYAQTSSASCLCKAGYEGNPSISDDCDLCGVGEYKEAPGNVACSTCKSGMTTASTGSILENACVCDLGYSTKTSSGCSPCSTTTYKGQIGDQVCSSCAANSHTSGGAVSSSQCLCDAGYAGPEGGPCTQCGEGSYAVANSPSCTFCPLNSNTINGIRTSPSSCLCAPGFTGDAGTGADCIECIKGTAKNIYANAPCGPCNDGEYAADDGQIVCDKCPVNYYGTGTGKSSCEKCPAGTESSEGSISVTACTDCGAGKFGATMGAGCLSCDEGTYSAGGGLTMCDECIAGTYSTASGATSSATCENCDFGEYSDIGANTCEPCAAGFFSNSQGSPTCTPCDGGEYSVSHQSACEQCDPGKYCASGCPNDCVECDPGHYASTPGLSSCSPCNTGTYAVGYGTVSCRSCPGGILDNRTGATNNSICDGCRSGTFYDVVHDICEDCPTGFFNWQTVNAESCDECLAGSYTGVLEGSSSCEECIPGDYNPVSQATTCETCSIGDFQPSLGQLGCLTCSYPYWPWQFAAGATSCVGCNGDDSIDAVTNVLRVYDYCSVCGGHNETCAPTTARILTVSMPSLVLAGTTYTGTVEEVSVVLPPHYWVWTWSDTSSETLAPPTTIVRAFPLVYPPGFLNVTVSLSTPAGAADRLYGVQVLGVARVTRPVPRGAIVWMNNDLGVSYTYVNWEVEGTVLSLSSWLTNSTYENGNGDLSWDAPPIDPTGSARVSPVMFRATQTGVVKVYANVSNALSYEVSGEPFTVIAYDQYPSLQAEVFPRASPFVGGSRIRIFRGVNAGPLYNTGEIQCEFHGSSRTVQVDATHISWDEVECIAPEWPSAEFAAEEVVIRVSLLPGVQDFFGDCPFTYGPHAVPQSTLPNNLVRYANWTDTNVLVNITGDELPSPMGMDTLMGQMFCKFHYETMWERIVSVLEMGIGYVICEAPMVNLSLIGGSLLDWNALSHVRISYNNGQQWSDAYATFAYTPQPRVESFGPSAALTLGGSNVIVFGGGFYSTSPSYCTFGNTSSLGQYLSPTMLLCFVPSHEAGPAVIRVSNNGLPLENQWSDVVVKPDFYFASQPEHIELVRPPGPSMIVNGLREPLPQQPIVRVLDGGDRVVESLQFLITCEIVGYREVPDGNTTVWEESETFNRDVLHSAGTSQVTVNGYAEFENLLFLGRYGSRYKFVFSLGQLTPITWDGFVELAPCSVELPYSSPSGLLKDRCICDAGYELILTVNEEDDSEKRECVKCLYSFYREDMWTDACVPCNEFEVTDGEGSDQERDCDCMEGYYRDPLENVPYDNDYFGDRCIPCIEGGYCPGGGIQPLPKPGFRRGEGEEIVFYPCPHCAFNGTCEDKYVGDTCSRCKDGWYIVEGAVDQKCAECSSFTEALLWICFAIVVLLCGLALRLNATRDDSHRYGTLRLMVNFAQVASYFLAASFQWPRLLTQAFRTLSLSNLNIQITAPECTELMRNLTWYTKFVLQMLLPVLFLVLLLFWYGLYHLHTIISRKMTVSNKLLSVMFKPATDELLLQYKESIVRTLIMGLSVLYLPLAKTSLEYFNCATMKDGTRWMVSAPEIPCDDSQYSSHMVLAIYGVLVYVIGIPLTFWGVLFRNRKLIKSPGITHYQLMYHPKLRKFSYLLARYDHRRCPEYEIHIFVRKLLVIMCLIFFSGEAALQLSTSIVVLLVAVMAHIRVQPYLHSPHNKLQTFTLGLLLVILMGGNLVRSDDLSLMAEEAITYTLIVLMSGMGVWFFASGFKEVMAMKKQIDQELRARRERKQLDSFLDLYDDAETEAQEEEEEDS